MISKYNMPLLLAVKSVTTLQSQRDLLMVK